jgi:hypothetical protein
VRRYLAPLQVLEAALLMRTATGPVVQLLQQHPKLTEDAIWLCRTVGEGLSMATGFGGALHNYSAPDCSGELALSRLVLLTQVRHIQPCCHMPLGACAWAGCAPLRALLVKVD